MEREISWARLLSLNQIREIVMDSDSDEEKYSASEDTEDEEPRPPSQWDIHDMNVYLSKDRQRVAQHLTATHNTVANLTRAVEGFGHKLYMDNFFSSPDLYDDLAQKKKKF
jgi:hypothetical protein